MQGLAIRLRGIVQGVGFRPFIWHLAHQYQLKGAVWNDEQGVMVHAFGNKKNLEAFVAQIPLQLPPLAKLDSLEIQELESFKNLSGLNTKTFQIISSRQNEKAQTPITADAAVCVDCIKEITDPNNRRYRYPFTNCTHCGPRLSIIRQVPYDRCSTSMAEFTMCESCQQEYDNPADRRFHAQTNCCADCGPQIFLEDSQAQKLTVNHVIDEAVKRIKQGKIIALKGLGGFHLVCDAMNEETVNLLRQRKRRYAKPFALMAKNLAMIKRYARLNDDEEKALTSFAAPIVILNVQGEKLAANIAIDDNKLGFMLPYTPLHYLLLQAVDKPLIMTSANLSDEPQCIDNDEARQKLGNIADYFLLHNRDIVNRVDDSLMRFMAGKMRILRRARGFTPECLKLPEGFSDAPNILAMGAELKNSFCLLKQGQAIVSQHIGDLENLSTQQDYRKNIELYQQLFDFKAEDIAVDLHPRYLSTQYGQQLAVKKQLNRHDVQHHHAHIAACMAEHGLPLNTASVLGVVYDGLGLGLQQQLWGGEFLFADYKSFKRLGYFQPISLLGGTQAILEPWRLCYAQLSLYFDWSFLSKEFANLEIIKFLQNKPLKTLELMRQKKINSPLSSSCGRYFDGFAAALDLCCEKISYEGQAAINLEILASSEFSKETTNAYPFAIQPEKGLYILNLQSSWLGLLNDLKQGIDKAKIAARIHHTLANATAEMLLKLSQDTKTDTIILAGGVFQNCLLFESVAQQLQKQHKMVLSAQQYPINDGSIALGQAVITAANIIQR